jgi:hypothetical protein
MKKVIRLTESDLTRLVRRVIKEQEKDAIYGGPKPKFHQETQKVSQCLKSDGYTVTIDGNGIMTARREAPYSNLAYIMVKSTPEPGKFDVFIQYKPKPGEKSLPIKKKEFVVDMRTMSDPLRLCKYIKDNTFVS